MKKGFTLIELLSVIVVLAIISVIAVPTLISVISKARLNALKDSAYGLIESSNLYYVQYQNSNNIRFDIDNNKVVSSDTTNLLKYKGNVKKGVSIIKGNGKTVVCVTDGKNSAYKNYNESKVSLVSGKKCAIPDNSSVVYLDGEATLSELSNQELTDQLNDLISSVNNLKSEVNNLKNKNLELTNQVELLSNYAMKSELQQVNTELSSQISNINSTLTNKISTLTNNLSKVREINWNSETIIGTVESFTAPSDGVAFVHIVGTNSGGWAWLKVNGKEIQLIQSLPDAQVDSFSIPLSKGDVLTIGSRNSNANTYYIHSGSKFFGYKY